MTQYFERNQTDGTVGEENQICNEEAQEEEVMKVIRYDANHKPLTKEDLKNIKIDSEITMGILNGIYNRPIKSALEKRCEPDSENSDKLK